ncbi:uncharacterized protein FIBRA_02736 [Fibroporia radiculosa]|uniref:Letm1 RBD domain-containing protein n=1 Tax=Fibroporia radiculosa TaxID=599839 RepID=J4HVE7_9APHY|nr:uncharacterized protein FIBRA_02736 [Fibroporia radiculosa]CCM00697.1 predicted protein [Fibroporia radiculosa]
MIIIIEEIIPLVVLYAPFVLPSTCLLPSQKERIDAKRREKQRLRVLASKPLFDRLRARMLASPATPVAALLDQPTLVALNGVLSLSTLGPNALRMRRLRQHLSAIAQDDALLRHESFGKMLSHAELRDAIEERGIITEGLSPKLWEARLESWLSSVDGEEDAFRHRVLLVASNGAGKF